MNLKQSHEKCFRSLRAVYRKPQIHDPFRHGIFYAQIFHRILGIRQRHLFLAAGNITQHRIDEAFQGTEASFGRQLAGLIAHRTVGNCGQIQDLISTHTKKTADQRLHLTFRDSFDKRFLSGIQIIVFIQNRFHQFMGKILPLFQTEQDLHYNLSCIGRCMITQD